MSNGVGSTGVGIGDGNIGVDSSRPSFIEVINAIKILLENDTDLAQFCSQRWSAQKLTVKKMFKRRNEINSRDLPVILITKPHVNKSFRTGTRDGTHTVRLYCGFYQPDRRNALEDFIEYEEMIDDVLLSEEHSKLFAINIKPLSSDNDEGMYHPVYFMTMDLEVQHRR